jgi:hypothetical protein
MEQRDDYAFWRSALEGKPIELTVGQAECGYYRHYTRHNGAQPVAVWRDIGSGELFYSIGNNDGRPADEAFCHDVFSWCCKNPVHEDAYWKKIETGCWPDEPPEKASNLPIDERESLKAEINGEKDEVERWLKEIGEVKTREQADRAGNWADRLTALEKRAEDTRRKEKQPFLDEAKAVDDEWKPFVTTAQSLKQRLKAACAAFLKTEAARVVQEHVDTVARGEQPVERPKPVKAGSLGRPVSLRTVTTAVIEDPKALAIYLVEQNNRDMMELLQTLANRLVKAGATPPGCKKHTDQVAA